MPAPVNHLEERLRDAGDPLTEIMPAAITLAMMLRQRNMAAWLRVEFEGYGAEADLPPYRRGIAGHIVAQSPQYGWIPAPVDAAQNSELGRLDLAEGVKGLEKTCLACKKGSGRQIALDPEHLATLQTRINLKAKLAITVSRSSYSDLVRTIRSVIYLWCQALIEEGAGGEHNSFTAAERAAVAHLDDPTRFRDLAMAEAGNLPVPGVREAGFFERVFGSAG